MSLRVYNGRSYALAAIRVVTDVALMQDDPAYPGSYLSKRLLPDPNQPGAYFVDGLTRDPAALGSYLPSLPDVAIPGAFGGETFGDGTYGESE